MSIMLDKKVQKQDITQQRGSSVILWDGCLFGINA